MLTELDRGPVPGGQLADWADAARLAHTKSAAKLLNVERAYEAMDRYNLDGLVASIPQNIYYLSSHRGGMQMMGRAFTTFAFFPRDPSLSPSLIVPGSMVYHLDLRPTWMPVEVYTYARADGTADPMPTGWVRNFREDGELLERDRVLMALYAQYEGDTTPYALTSLAKVLKREGLSNARLGFDDPRVIGWLNGIGLPSLTGVDAQNLFRWIRMVKTPNEIDILRQAAQKNDEALDYVIDQMYVGQPMNDLPHNHGRKWGELGGSSRWLIANQRGLASGLVEKDTVTKIDSVGEYLGYLGDVGRTVVVGAPTDEVVRRAEASAEALTLCYAAIKPGMTFAESQTIIVDYLREKGFRGFGGGAHNVGLDHTDQPWPTGAPNELPGLFEPLTYQVGTVFTMDVVYHGIGWGTSHVEDMVVVTETGCEGLSSLRAELRIVPA
jgi:Xaa-Pro aminopeptidase